MSKLKSILLTTTAYIVTAALAIGGTVAYLTSKDSDVNVMTLGNVEIVQHEYERVLKEDGTYEMYTSAKYGEGYKLQEFTQAKPLYPATGEITGWGTKVPFDQLGEGASGAQSVFAGLNNVQDKFVLVENTGKSDAYVRTFIALEYGSNTKDIIGISTGDFWIWNDLGIYEIEGNNYYVFEAIYNGSSTRHQGGVLPAGEFTYNSLGQVYLKNEATNEDVEALDGNGNGTYDILVLSQAVQTAGFENAADAFTTYSARATAPTNAKVALDTAFGAPEEVNTATDIVNVVEWLTETEKDTPVTAGNPQELKDAMLIRGAKIVLDDDIVVDSSTPLQWGLYMFVANGREVTIDLNGHDIILDETASTEILYMFTTANKGILNIVGEGNLISKNGISGICRAMNKGDQINIYGGDYYCNGDVWADDQPLLYTNSGNIDVYGGKFHREGHWLSNAEDIQGDRLSIVFHEGALFPSESFQQGDSTRIQLAEGCSLKAVEIDGQTWYKVVK